MAQMRVLRFVFRYGGSRLGFEAFVLHFQAIEVGLSDADHRTSCSVVADHRGERDVFYTLSPLSPILYLPHYHPLPHILDLSHYHHHSFFIIPYTTFFSFVRHQYNPQTRKVGYTVHFVSSSLRFPLHVFVKRNCVPLRRNPQSSMLRRDKETAEHLTAPYRIRLPKSSQRRAAQRHSEIFTRTKGKK